jgi:hypothetical protein
MSANYSRYEQGGYGDDGLPDYIYYNGDVINNRTDDWDNNDNAYVNPFIQFNETRDSALVKDASKYHFSIVRFAMNGPSKAIPLFIPSIQAGPTQIQDGVTFTTSDVNLTNYGAAICSKQTWQFTLSNAATANLTFAVTPPVHYMEYISEFQNTIVAPTPNIPNPIQDINPASKYYSTYSYNSVVNMINQTFSQCNYNLWYWLNQAYQFIINKPNLTFPIVSQYYTISISAPLGVGVSLVPSQKTDGLTNYNYYIGAVGGNQAVAAVTVPPMMTYSPTNYLFTLAANQESGYGTQLLNFIVAGQGPNTGLVSQPDTYLYVNNNMWGLMGNYPFTYVNKKKDDIFGTGTPVTLTEGYVYQLNLDNQSYANNVEYNTPQYPDGTVAYTAGTPNLTGNWYVCQQDFKTIDQLWSPVASIVFTTGLIPIRAEATGQPVITGTSNTSLSAPTSQSAFQPIITDVVLPMTDGAADYCGFVYYAPAAEYRMSSLASSPIDIRSIDLQVFYRNRLNNTLYPISMFNLSNVSFKIMFRHKRLGGAFKERQ